ncbi:MAG: hypothetical protein V1858_05380 [Candidatus Gottesmanbacteria bacterium]
MHERLKSPFDRFLRRSREYEAPAPSIFTIKGQDGKERPLLIGEKMYLYGKPDESHYEWVSLEVPKESDDPKLAVGKFAVIEVHEPFQSRRDKWFPLATDVNARISCNAYTNTNQLCFPLLRGLVTINLIDNKVNCSTCCISGPEISPVKRVLKVHEPINAFVPNLSIKGDFSLA